MNINYMVVPEKSFQVRPIEGGSFKVALEPGFVEGLSPDMKERLKDFLDEATGTYAVVATWDGAIPYAKKVLVSHLNGFKPEQAQPIVWRRTSVNGNAKPPSTSSS